MGLHLDPQLVQLLVSEVVQLVQTEPEFPGQVAEAVLVIVPGLVEVLGAVETVLEHLRSIAVLVCW